MQNETRFRRRERKTNKWPLKGSCPITAFTRSARRSKPQRMSADSAASQMRVFCSRSSVRKLGRPVKRETPARPTAREDEQDRSRARPVGFGRRPVESQLRIRVQPPAEVLSRNSSSGPQRRAAARQDQAFLPGEEVRWGKATCPAERRHTLIAPLLFGDQFPPLCPDLRSTCAHDFTVGQAEAAFKMGFA